MKNKILVPGLLFALLFVSCKKSYTCNCNVDTVFVSNGGTLSTKSQSTAYSEKMNKTQAKSACSHEQTSIQSSEDNLFTANGQQANPAKITVACTIQ